MTAPWLLLATGFGVFMLNAMLFAAAATAFLGAALL